MKIDAHHHLWDLNAVSYPWIMDKTPRFFGDHTAIRRDYLIDEFSSDARAQGFEASVHIQVGAADPLAEARWVDRVAQEAETWPLVQVAFCDVTAKSFAQDLAELQNLKSLRGVRQIVGRSPEEDAKTGTNDLLDNPAFLEGLKRLAGEGLSFDLQLIPELMPRMGEVLAQVPDLKVALCHAGSPYDRSFEGLSKWVGLLKSLSDQSQISCKLSGLGMFEHGWTIESFRPIVEECVSQFGVNRLMFGSNFPVCSLTSSYERLFETYAELIPVDEHARIFGETAAKFYRV